MLLTNCQKNKNSAVDTALNKQFSRLYMTVAGMNTTHRAFVPGIAKLIAEYTSLHFNCQKSAMKVCQTETVKIKAMCVLQDGRLITAFCDGTVHVKASVFDKKCQFKWKVGRGDVLGIYELCAEKVVFHYHHYIGVVFMIDTGKHAYYLGIPPTSPITISPKKTHIACIDQQQGHNVYIFTIIILTKTGKIINIGRSPFKNSCFKLDASEQTIAFCGNTRLLIGGPDGMICEWDIERGVCVGMLVKHRTRVVSIVVLSTGNIAVSIDLGGQLCVWDMRCRVCISTHQVRYHPQDNQRIYSTADPEEFIIVSDFEGISGWNIHTGMYKCIELNGMDVKTTPVNDVGVLVVQDKQTSLWM